MYPILTFYTIYTGMVCVLIITFHSFSVFVDILDFVHVLFHTYFGLELYFEPFSCNAPASAKTFKKEFTYLLTYFMLISQH